MFAADLPKNLCEFMRDKVFDELMYAKDFQQSVEIRDEVKLIMGQLLDKWDGKLSELTKKSLLSSIELADEAGRNKIFGWYINKVSPLIQEQCKVEAKISGYVFDTNVMPITMFLLCFYDAFGVCHHLDEFNFEMWEYALDWLKLKIGRMKPLDKEGVAYFPPCPYSKEELDKFKAEEKEPPT